jgi:adenylyltransferase/sulfurtransferase
LRYARHVVLDGIGAAGQARLAHARALIVGLGGLGSPAAYYLAAAGIGELVLNDFDRVDDKPSAPNPFGEADIGLPKTDAAAASLTHLNSRLRTALVTERLRGRAHEVRARHDIVLDDSDNRRASPSMPRRRDAHAPRLGRGAG